MIIAVSFLMLESCTNKKEMELEKIIKEVEEQIIHLRKEAAAPDLERRIHNHCSGMAAFIRVRNAALYHMGRGVHDYQCLV